MTQLIEKQLPCAVPKDGKAAERIAVDYLKREKIKIIKCNYYQRCGEIDIIAIDGSDNILFIEVKFRRKEGFGGVFGAIDAVKMQKIRQTASLWLQQNDKYQQYLCRFDAIFISGESRPINLCWLQGV